MLCKRTNLARPSSLRAHAERRAVLAGQLTQRVVHAQDTVNIDVHRDLVHDHGKVNELLGGQIGDLNGLGLILGIQGDVHGVTGTIQRNTRALNFAIGRTLDEQLPRLS